MVFARVVVVALRDLRYGRRLRWIEPWSIAFALTERNSMINSDS